MRKRLECIVKGRVQLVTFRDFTKRKARRFEVVGTVENLSDGTVKVVAEGEEEKLTDFLSLLKKGPTFARVDDVLIEWKDPAEKFKTFEILYRNFLDRL